MTHTGGPMEIKGWAVIANGWLQSDLYGYKEDAIFNEPKGREEFIKHIKITEIEAEVAETKSEKVWTMLWNGGGGGYFFRTKEAAEEVYKHGLKEATLTYEVPRPKGVTKSEIEEAMGPVGGNFKDSVLQRILTYGLADESKASIMGVSGQTSGVGEVCSSGLSGTLITREKLEKAWGRAAKRTESREAYLWAVIEELGL